MCKLQRIMHQFQTTAAAFLFAIPVIALGANRAGGQEWTRFRGPNGSGIGRGIDLPQRWTDRDFNWRIKLPGTGHSSPVVWGRRLFITSGDEETAKRLVICIDTTTGKPLWQREFTSQRHGKHELNSFASSTPAVDGRQLYVTWGTPNEYVVLALTHDGDEVWRTDLGPFKCGHGFGASPVVLENLVIVPNDQDGTSSLVALDCGTGGTRWKAPRQGKASYITPCVFQPEHGRGELIFSNWDHGITSFDPKTGEKNWELDIFDKGHTETAIGSPIVAGDLVIAVCGWLGVRKEVVAVRLPRNGRDDQAREMYRIDRSAPLCTTPLVNASLLFLWSDEGIVTCADVQTGEVFWRERVGGTFYGSPVCAANRLYAVSADGDMVVLAASKKFELLASHPLGEGTHSTPAISGGRMFVRTFSQLFSLGGSRSE